jgi:DNA-binding transcriptional regulator YhcF (GntR family)
MPLKTPNVFMVPKEVVGEHLAGLTASECKVLIYLLASVPWLDRPALMTSRALADKLQMARQTVVTALDGLEEKGLIEARETGDGKYYNLRQEEDRGVVQNLDHPGLKIRPPQDTPYIRSRAHALNTSLQVNNTRESTLVSDSNESETRAEPAPVVNPLLSDLNLPLRVRVMVALSDTHRLPLENEAEAPSDAEVAERKLNPYQKQMRLLRALWKLLYGEETMPDYKMMASLVSKHGGYRGGGAQKLADVMLRYANLDTNPLAMILAGAIKTRVEQQQNANRYKDYGDMEAMPKRERDLDV